MGSTHLGLIQPMRLFVPPKNDYTTKTPICSQISPTIVLCPTTQSCAAALSQQGEVGIVCCHSKPEFSTPTQGSLSIHKVSALSFCMSHVKFERKTKAQECQPLVYAALPDRAVHKAAKALSFSLFMTLKQGHCSRVIRAPPVKSRVRYRLSATIHNHRTPGSRAKREREGRRDTATEMSCVVLIMPCPWRIIPLV